MENANKRSLIERAAAGAKSEPDNEARARENDTRAREIIANIEATSALNDELLRQMFADLKKMRPQIESDPKLLLLPLQALRVVSDTTNETSNLLRALLQSNLKLAEGMSLDAETENDPDIKRHFREVSDRIRANVASESEKVRELEMKQQLRSQELDSILADINELIAASACDEKDPK